MNNPLKYSNCWEDAQLLGQALAIDPESQILSIASGGDNSLYLLKYHPASLTAVDLNPIQLHIIQLKENGIRHLTRPECLDLLGFTNTTGEDRWQLFMKISNHLPLNAKQYYIEHQELITNGIINEGKFEKYLQLFALKVLPWIHSRKTVDELFKPKDMDQQGQFINNKWDNLRWKWLFKIFFSRFVMGRLGREPEKLAHVKGSVGNRIYSKAMTHLTSIDSQKNYMLHYMLKGHFGEHLPPYLRKENYESIQSWLLKNRIQYREDTLENILTEPADYNKFNLSNIFEYMSESAFQGNIDVLTKQAKNQSRIAYWNLLVPRDINNPAWKNVTMNKKDNGFFYDSFNILERCNQ